MDRTSPLPPSAIRQVRDACLCLAAQRAARRLARRFDRAFQPVGLTNGQYSALMFLAGAPSQSPGSLAESLGMDRTSVTALLKALQRRGLAETLPSAEDRRLRRFAITPTGHALLVEAARIWRAEHARLEAELPAGAAPQGRLLLRALAQAPLPA